MITAYWYVFCIIRLHLPVNPVSEEEKMRRHQKTDKNRRRQSRSAIIIRTTLYELIETVIDTVGPEEKHSVTPVMLELLEAFCPTVNLVDA
jgi:hypothetical protein